MNASRIAAPAVKVMLPARRFTNRLRLSAVEQGALLAKLSLPIVPSCARLSPSVAELEGSFVTERDAMLPGKCKRFSENIENQAARFMRSGQSVP